MGTTAYPSSLDTYDDVDGAKQSESVGGRLHDAQHNDAWAAIVALQTKVGTGALIALARLAAGGSDGQVVTQVAGALALAAPSSSAANLLSNGDMSIDRAVGPYTNTGSRNNDASETLTGWYVLSDGNNIVSVAQDTTIANIPTGARAALKATVVTTNKKFGFVKFLTRAQSMAILAGTASLRFKARTHASNIIANMRVGILTWSGTADAYTLDVVSTTNWGTAGTSPTLATNWTYENTPANLALTSSWQTFDVAGAAIDTASGANVAVFFWSDDTTTTASDELWLSEVSLIPGASASDIVKRHILDESHLNKPSQSAVGVTSGPTTASTTYVDLTNMAITLNTYGGDLEVKFDGTFTNNSTSSVENIALSLDGAAEVAERQNSWTSAGFSMPMMTSHRFTDLAPGSHTIKARWKVSGGTTGTAVTTFRELIATEV